MADCTELALSLVIPAFNEAERLPSALASIREFLGERLAYEVIVVSDGSTDATEEIVREWQIAWPELRLIAYQPNRGKGHAVRQGVLASRGDTVLMFDADGATPISEWPKLLAALEAGADLAVGSRRNEGAHIERPQPWRRRVMGWTLSHLTRSLLGLPIRDTQCGFKLFRGHVAQSVFAASVRDGWDFDLEILLLVQSLEGRIVEVGVRWLDAPGSKVRPVRDSFRFLKSLAVLAWRFRLSFGPRPIAQPRAVHVP